jgi:hypothetical protein
MFGHWTGIHNIGIIFAHDEPRYSTKLNTSFQKEDIYLRLMREIFVQYAKCYDAVTEFMCSKAVLLWLLWKILSRFRGYYWRGVDWILDLPLGTTSNYSAIADIHTLQFTVTHTLGFSVFTSCILTTDVNSGDYTSLTVTAVHIKSFVHSQTFN